MVDETPPPPETATEAPAWRPPAEDVDLLRRFLAPWRLLLDPVAFHLDRIPEERPLLLVGNHTLYGFLDIPHFWLLLADQRGIWLRGLGDHFHFAVPGWGELLRRFGVVDGTPEACAALLQRGEAVLVFPGGAREVAKRRGEQNQLVWGNRLGFARQAIAAGATVVPFAMLGGDEAWSIVADADEQRRSPLGPLIEAAYRLAGIPLDSMMPLARGVAWTPMPRPVRLYFSVGQPISTAAFQGRPDDDGARALRDLTATAIQAELEALLAMRLADPRKHLVGRALQAVARRLPRE